MAAIERLGKYRILEEIRYGGIGLVYKAEDTLLKRIVALKVIAEEGDVTDELRSRFFKDAQACAKLSHPNMVTVYDASEEQGRLFMVLEYVEGEELERTIAGRHEQPLEDKLAIMIQICRGLGYAHQKGVMHRDVRPENVLVLRTGTIKLLDVGIARIAARSEAPATGSGLIGHALRYAAPEQTRGEGDVRSDIFSAAALFYELVASRGPLRGEDPLAILERLDSPTASLYSPDPAIPADLEAVLERALRRDPHERFRDMSQLQGALEAVRRRLREEARSLHRRIESGAGELGRLRAALTERMDGAPASPVLVPDEQLPVSVLESRWREQQDEIERSRALLERAESLRPAYEDAKSWADNTDWSGAVAALERIVEIMPEHAGAVEALRQARARRDNARSAASPPAPEDDAETVLLDRAQLEPAQPVATELVRRVETDVVPSRETNVIRPLESDLVHRVTTDLAPLTASPPPEDAETVVLDRSRLEPARAPETDLVQPAESTPAAEAATTLVDRAARAPRPAPASPVPAGTSPTAALPPPSVFPRPKPPVGSEAPVRSRAGAVARDARRKMLALAPSVSRRTLAIGGVVLVVVAVGLYWLLAASETSRQLERELAGVRRQVESARDGARRAGADQLTPELFASATNKQTEAGELARAHRTGEAIATLGEAARRYGEAERNAVTAGKARDAADEAKRRMLADKARGVPGTPEMAEGLAREQLGEQRYRDRQFADAAQHFDAAGPLFAKTPSTPVATGAEPSPPPPRPPVTTPPGRAADADIRDLLRAYSRAFETKDVGVLQQIRPGLRREDIARHRAVFAQTKSYRLSLKVDAIDMRGDEAEARGQREDVIVTESGETVQTSATFAFRFKRVDERWRIESVR